MKTKKRFYFLPKTRIGKISFFTVIIAFIGIYLQYWIAMAFNLSIPIPFGMLSMILLVICGITSIISIIKYRDYALVLFLTSLLGLFGILFIIGEFIFPH
jgi:hypothetical protein